VTTMFFNLNNCTVLLQ